MAFANTINREIIYHQGGFDDNPRRKSMQNVFTRIAAIIILSALILPA